MFKTLFRVLKLYKNNKKIITLIVIINFVFAGLTLIEPIIYGKIIDVLVNFSSSVDNSFSELYSILFYWIIVGICLIILKLTAFIISGKLTNIQYHKDSLRIFSYILDLSYRFHTNTNSGKLVKNITKAIDSMRRFNQNFFRYTSVQIFIIIILIPIVLYLNFKLGLFVIIFGMIFNFVAFFIASKTFSKQMSIEDLYSEMGALYSDTFSNISVVKSFNLRNMKRQRLKKISKKVLDEQFPLINYWGATVSISRIASIIISIGVLFFGSYLFVQGEISIGMIITFLNFAILLLANIERLMWDFESVFWGLSSIKDYFKMLDSEIEIKYKLGAKNLKNIKGEVEFKNLTFSYDGKRNVLKNIDIKIKPGESIAFVGHTGSGKTTMTNMLFRFFDPQKGKVLIDGIDIKTVTQESLRENIGAVFQESFMFNGTIMKNIKLDTNASLDKIKEVAKKSHSLEFIEKLPKSFNTIIGERGVKLSGGEKQRLAIARAFLKNAPILVLDEATSALDTQTEKYLQSSFEKLMKGKTAFIIAHRLSTIRKADRIFVFDSGKIVETGTYKELKAKGGIFANLVKTQIEGFVN